MSQKLVLAAILALSIVTLLPTSPAAAGDYGWHFPRGFGYSGSLYGLGYVPVPPYFSLHPPVYYSEQLSRTYGTSPFACGCGNGAPTPVQRAAVAPNVRMMPEKPQPAERMASMRRNLPQVVENPFCRAADRSKDRLASH